MRVVPTRLPDVLVIETDSFQDERGFFMESYHKARYAEHGIKEEFVQDNHSGSKRGVLRGFHYQDDSAPMGKLVRCLSGAILDVAADLRVGSPTFGRWAGVELSAGNRRQVLVPHGFGHAFLALTEDVEVLYKCSGFYSPAAEGTVAWDDPDLAVQWPLASPVLSPRDASAMSLREYLRRPAFVYRQG
jgi:dTDP-4-dehydrorhamnose 3,5-epimerase